MSEPRFITVVLKIPERLYEVAARQRLDIEYLLAEALLHRASLDPSEEVSIRLVLAEKYLQEAREYLERGDPVQASEKLYKVAEECIKVLAVKFSIPELEEARREGRWWTKLLSRAAKTLSARLGDPTINRGWCVAYDLHVWGFHEAALSIDHVRTSLQEIEQLLEKTRQYVKSST